jgi:hypothetical protein
MADKREAEGAERLVDVPHAQLDPEVLRHLVEEFVTRDGTDYGAIERTLPQKVAAVMRQLETGEAAIVVDLDHDTIDIVLRRPR